MPAQNIPYIVGLFIASAISAVVVVYAWNSRPARAATSFSILMVAVFLWSIGYAMELATPDAALKVIWLKRYFIGVVTVPVLWFVFCVRFSGRGRWLTNRNGALLFFVPVISLVLLASNERHLLFWESLAMLNNERIVTIVSEYGPWFNVHLYYSYALILGGAYYLLSGSLNRAKIFREQTIALLIAVLTPLLGNAIFVFDIIHLEIDPTPFLFTVTGVAILWGVFRVQLFDVIPAARDAVLESMNDGVVVLDAQNRIVDINPAAREFVKKWNPSITRIVGERVRTVMAPWPEIVERFYDVSSTQTMVELPVGDDRLFVELRISSFRDSRGKVNGRVLTVSDVTVRRNAEALQRAKDAAEATSTAKSAFLANMSHELRTPLNHIIGYSEMLEEDAQAAGNEEAVADLQKIRDAGRSLLGLISSVLEISRLEAGMVGLDLETVDPVSLADDAAMSVQSKITANGNHFELIADTNLPQITTDPNHARKVLVNLLENSAKFTTDGTVTLQVTNASDVQGEWLIYRVKDTGIGMSALQIESLFQPFTPGDNSSTRNYDGAGLGLATSQKLCEIMGGSIMVESEQGKGSIFTVRIPQRKVKDGTDIID